MPLSIRDYQDALDVQSACNLSGVIHSFSKVISKIFEEGKGTEYVNNHPICRLYAEQITYLTGAGSPSNSESYFKAYEQIESTIKTGKEVTQ